MANYPQRGGVLEVDTIALLQAIPDPDMITRTFYVRGRTTVGDGGEGFFRWVSGDATATNLGTVFAHDSVSGRFFRQYSGSINAKWFGATGDGTTNDTTALTNWLAQITNNKSGFLPPGRYVTSTLTATSRTEITILGYGSELIHPVEGDTGRVVTSPVLKLLTCTESVIKGVKVEGQHLDASVGDNAYQSGIYLEDCVSCRVVDCWAYNIRLGFVVIGSSSHSNQLLNCHSKQTNTGFHAGSQARFTKFIGCVSEHAHYTPDSAPKSAGYGFLSDNATETEFIACDEYYSGSNGFRLSGADSSRSSINNCRSFYPARESFSARSSGSSNIVIRNCYAYENGDPTYWNGAVGSYTEAISSPTFLYVSTPGTIVSNVSGRATHSSMTFHAYFDASGIKVSNAVFNSHVNSNGVQFTSSASDSSLVNSSITIQTLGAGAGRYPIYIDATGVRIDGVSITGGNDGVLILKTRASILNCYISNTWRYGIFINSTQANINNNTYVHNLAGDANASGFYANGSDLTMGYNVTVDTIASMYRSLWIRPAVTNVFPGVIVERGSNVGIRNDNGSAAYINTVASMGKAALLSDSTAPDVATLVTDFNNLLSRLRNANILTN